MKHKEFDKEELEVGMKVAIPTNISSGYGVWYRYPVWRSEKIKALTPKKTKITLEGGQVYLATKDYRGWHTGMYEPDEEMEFETKLANAFMSAKNAVFEMYQKSYTKIQSLNDDDLLDFAAFVIKAGELLRGKKENED